MIHRQGAVVAIVLAAGASQRMGTPKPLLKWSGEPLVRRTVRVLREGGAAKVVVVIAPGTAGVAVADVVKDLPEVGTIVNASPERGMLSSIQEGVRTALVLGADGFFVCPCDLPKLRSEHVAAVLTAGQETGAIIAVPIFTGQRGHPTLFGAKLADEILSLNPLEFGLNEILKRHAHDVREVAMPDDAVLRDADTPGEWRALQDEMTMDRGFRDAP
jgi:molybdenum cofactor cytidylyltransferase